MTTIQFFQSRHSPDSSDMAPSIERQPIDYLQQNKTVYTPVSLVNIIPKGFVGAIYGQKLDRISHSTVTAGDEAAFHIGAPHGVRGPDGA